ncbi:MAG: PEGA domain-containing protein [Polyangiaceae bacterium]|nr:PEGA domain-containing protein [Polyangiaceae bacterium]MCW5791197.1 PEGA domain-containing protein [Polyangiaceae bacterium]
MVTSQLSALTRGFGGFALMALITLGWLCGCGPGAGRAAVSMRITGPADTPRDASVFIDEEYVGPLGFVAARGVRLPVGEHRITVQKDGYFPWDAWVEADRQPVQLRVELIPIPD